MNRRNAQPMPILSIRHVTRYRYRNPVALGEHRMMFRPHESYDQQLLSADLAICPTPSKIQYLRDVFGNSVGVADFAGRTTDLVFDSYVRLRHTPHLGVSEVHEDFDLRRGADRFAYGEPELTDLAASIAPAHPDPDGVLRRWTERFLRRGGPVNAASLLIEMTRAIQADFTYRKRLEKGPQTPLETLTLNSGSCRDYAVLMIEAARGLGLAARFSCPATSILQRRPVLAAVAWAAGTRTPGSASTCPRAAGSSSTLPTESLAAPT